MLEFRKLRFEDKSFIQSFFDEASISICDYSFATIFTWRKKFKPEFSVFDNFLIVRYFINNHYEYLFPIGKGSLNVCFEEIIAYAEQHSEAVILGAVTTSMCTHKCQFIDDNFLFFPNRNNWEYMYETKSLVELKGKSFQPKRNFINRFQKLYPNYSSKKLDQSDFENCVNLCGKWYDNHSSLVDTQDLQDERDFIDEVFANYSQLDFDGVGLYVGNELVAFAIGSQVSPDTYVEHIEKALPTYVGAYPVINNLFAQMVNRDYGCDYINREEDMGLPALRKAKLQYNPSFFLEKGGLIQKKNPFADVATKDDIPEIKLLWKCIFGDDDIFLNRYFDVVFPESISLVVRHESHVISSLQLVPYSYVCEGKMYSAYYVYAVMTNPKFGNQGNMTSLINLAKQVAVMNGKDFLCLVPDDSEKLRVFYRKFGFFDGFRISTVDSFFRFYDENLSVEENYQNYLENLTDNSILMPFSQFYFEVKNYADSLKENQTVNKLVACNLNAKVASAMVFLLNENLSVEKLKLANGGLLMTE